MTTYSTPLALAKKLITLPSYVNDSQDETPATDFLFDFLLETFPDMIVEKQYLNDSKRCNLILRGSKTPKLFVLGHIDTVQPKGGWQTNPLGPVVKDGSLYGLGASDMKSSLAAFLWTLAQEQATINRDELMLLIYIDEEYDFKGIKRFLADKASSIVPRFTLSLDGELAVATGCRGLIEISMAVKGKSGHSSNPDNGINAITATISALQATSQALAAFTDPELGQTTTNIAYLQGGTLQIGEENVWLRNGNIIPDTVEFVFEVRPSTSRINAERVLQELGRSFGQNGLTPESVTIRHDIAPWPVQYENVRLIRCRLSIKPSGYLLCSPVVSFRVISTPKWSPRRLQVQHTSLVQVARISTARMKACRL